MTGPHLGSRLTLIRDVLPNASSGTWQYSLPLSDPSDGDQRTLRLVAADAAGNQSQPVAVSYRYDNVAPVLTASVVVTAVTVAAADPNPVVLTGNVSDGGGLKTIYASIRTLSGDFVTARVDTLDITLVGLRATGASSRWQLALPVTEAGQYEVTIQAVDLAGNITASDPFLVQATRTAPLNRVYLPVASRAGATGAPDTSSGAGHW